MKEKRARCFLFTAGILAVLLSTVPYLIMGERAVVTYHDQLDGEMIAYILQAKHLWRGNILPEFLGGADKTALTPPAPACVLFYLGGDYFAALIGMQLLGRLAGFTGMYLLVREMTGRPLASALAGGLYAMLPFLPVYGLSQYGLPLLFWCVLQLERNRRVKTAYVYGLVYALNSSLVLVGFAVLVVYALFILRGMFAPARAKDADRKRCLIRQSVLWGILLAVYTLTNLSLIGQILGPGTGEISHKTEYVLAAEPFLTCFGSSLLYGGQHSGDQHLFFVWAVCLTAVLALLAASVEKRREEAGTRLLARMAALFGCEVSLAGISALWNSGAGVWLRSRLGALGAFQMDRLLWLAPCLWYLLLGCGIALAASLWRSSRKLSRGAGALGMAALAVAICVTGFQILKGGDLKANLRKLLDPDYPAISYADYYAVGVMEQVGDFLDGTTGRGRETYRVASLGIDPAAAMYHGFYCLDGYSNNYSLEYKHRFREIIAPELEKSEYLKGYYDGWGNRCYLFSSECPGYYTIEKNGFYFQDLAIDTAKLRQMGGEYLFSAAYIANAEELGLALLREEPFETEDSYYRIFLYGVN